MTASSSSFTSQLMHWHRHQNRREMPWKGERDPYKIWLSEIILQQTRVAQGTRYYERFVQAFPTVQALAAAQDDAAMRLWEGLGYYSRCRNLLATARTIVHEYGGAFPPSYEQLLALKGVGPYTAAAIASFAFGLPHAVLDGNVYRVLSRYFGIETPSDGPDAGKVFPALAASVLYAEDAGAYNQAIMDFGATVCKPQTPLCGQCPLNNGCIAYKKGMVAKLPVRIKKAERSRRYFMYFWVWKAEQGYMQQRPAGDIWAGLYEPYLLETDDLAALNHETAHQWMAEQWGIEAPFIMSPAVKQLLTHQQITLVFVTVHISSTARFKGPGQWYTKQEMEALPKPVQIAQFLKTELIQTRLW